MTKNGHHTHHMLLILFISTRVWKKRLRILSRYRSVCCCSGADAAICADLSLVEFNVVFVPVPFLIDPIRDLSR